MSKGLWILIPLMILLASCVAPTQPITVGNGTPMPAPSGEQVEAYPVQSLKGLGGQDCRVEFADQGILGICKVEITRAEVLAVPGLNEAVMKGLLKIAVWVTANQALTLEPITQADPVAWVIPWQWATYAQEREAVLSGLVLKDHVSSGEVEVNGWRLRGDVWTLDDDCKASVTVDLQKPGQNWEPLWTTVFWLDPCGAKIDRPLIEALMKALDGNTLQPLLKFVLEAIWKAL